MAGYMQNDLYSIPQPQAHLRNPPTLHRQPSRTFESMRSPSDSPNLFNNMDNSLPLNRFENTNVDRFSSLTMHTPRMNGFNMGYDMNVPGPQSYGGSVTPFSDGGFNGATTVNGPSYTSRVRLNQTRDVRAIWAADSGQSFPTAHQFPYPSRPDAQDAKQQEDEQLIATAIVIKNIPFAVKKEQLQDFMVGMRLPIPYAFNYHFDNGVFRGLAFANFTSAADTEEVIRGLDGCVIQGRRLKVEYKKMLPQEERERIERVKREKRGQLQEQHQPMDRSQLQTVPSVSSLSSHFHRGITPSPSPSAIEKPKADYNDPVTREFLQTLTIFKAGPEEKKVFPSNLSDADRHKLHLVAHEMDLFHASHGEGDQRCVTVSKHPEDSYPPHPFLSIEERPDPTKRTVTRAATTEFNVPSSRVRAQYSHGNLPAQDENGGIPLFGNNLRGSKSHMELPRGTPSPSPSTANSGSGFPTNLQSNATRLQQLNGQSEYPLTPSAQNGISSAFNSQREDFLKDFSGLSLRSGMAPGGSPRRKPNIFSGAFETQQPIGSNRSIGSNYEGRASSRQPQGPIGEGIQSFERRNGPIRSTEDMRSDVKPQSRVNLND